MRRLGEFFLNFQSMQEGFVTRAREVEKLLHDRRTTFCVVSTLESAPLAEAEFFCTKLEELDFDLGALVLNRALPDFLHDPAAAAVAQRLDDVANAGETAKRLDALDPVAFGDEARTAGILRTIADNFENFAVVAKREAEMQAELSTGNADVIARVPQFEVDIADLGGLLRIGDHLFG